jgi:hypothetical protein
VCLCLAVRRTFPAEGAFFAPCGTLPATVMQTGLGWNEKNIEQCVQSGTMVLGSGCWPGFSGNLTDFLALREKAQYDGSSLCRSSPFFHGLPRNGDPHRHDGSGGTGMGTSSPSVLILYYSLSAQTGVLVQRLASGLEEEGCQVHLERLQPLQPLKFPLGTIPATLAMMVITLLRGRVPIKPLSPECERRYDLAVVAGPTWSYNPSGPVLSLLDRDGVALFAGRRVLPLISCRGYWRLHWWGLRSRLQRCGGEVVNRMVFSHPCPEPWRTIGVFLKLAGRVPERGRFLGRYYQRYGHSRAQQEEAFHCGRSLGRALREKTPLADLQLTAAAGE